MKMKMTNQTTGKAIVVTIPDHLIAKGVKPVRYCYDYQGAFFSHLNPGDIDEWTFSEIGN